jgi:hypothetical protein
MNNSELIDVMLRRLGGELKGILHQVERGQIPAVALERVLRERMWHVAAQAMGMMLEALDRQVSAGRPVHDYRTRTIMSLFGPIDIARCRCGQDGRYVCPLDEAIGLDGHRSWTAGVQEAVALLSCESSFETVADLMDRLLGVAVSPATVQQLAQAAGERAEALPAAPPGRRERPDTLIVAVDGCQAPQRDGWHEVKIATLYSKDARCRTSGGRGRLTAKHYLATLANAEGFGQALGADATAYGALTARRVVMMGDGAAWIWNLSAMQFPQATEIVDFYHAAEHLWAVGEALWGDRQTSVRTRSWVRRYRRYLREGRVKLVLAAIDRSAVQQQAALTKERRKTVDLNREYFRRNAWRMRYGRFRQMGLPIGTGAVEGACKHVVQSRLKRPGTRWSEPGLKSMLALKVTRLNNRWEELWPKLYAA